MAQTVKQKQAAAKARLAKKAHATKDKSRATDIIDIKVSYSQKAAQPVLDDILAKAKKFQDYHLKIAQDGIGAKKTGYKLDDGSEEVETVTLNPNERASQLDKSSGIQELIDYIERTRTPVSETLAQAAK